MIGILNRKYDGKVPLIPILDGRKLIAKFIGLSLFKVGPNCRSGINSGITGPCCSKHQLEGLKESHEFFPKIFEPFGIFLDKIDSKSDTFFTSLLAIYADFKTQIIVKDLIFNLTEASSETSSDGLTYRLENLLETFYGPAMNISYLKTKLQQRTVEIRRIVEQETSSSSSSPSSYKNLIENLSSKFSFDLFENNLKNILRNVYNSFPETFLSELVGNSVDEPKNIIESVADKDTVSEPAIFKAKAIVNEPAIVKTVAIASLSDKNVANDAVIVKDVPKVMESPFKNVIISGKFFRGILEPVDERFAAIIEGRDVNVKQYLSLRQKNSLLPFNKRAKTVKTHVASNENMEINRNRNTKITTTNNAIGSNLSSANRSSLMERHESAERIGWGETQDNYDLAKEDQSNLFENDGSNKGIEKVVSLKRTKESSLLIPVTFTSVIRNRGRKRFSDKEVGNLIDGIRRFGRDWRRILTNYEFDGRTNVDLKDKARNLEKMGLLN